MLLKWCIYTSNVHHYYVSFLFLPQIMDPTWLAKNMEDFGRNITSAIQGLQGRLATQISIGATESPQLPRRGRGAGPTRGRGRGGKGGRQDRPYHNPNGSIFWGRGRGQKGLNTRGGQSGAGGAPRRGSHVESPPCHCKDLLTDLAERVEVLNSQVFRLKEELGQLRGDREFGGMVLPGATSEVPQDASEATMDASENLLLGSPLDLH